MAGAWELHSGARLGGASRPDLQAGAHLRGASFSDAGASLEGILGVGPGVPWAGGSGVWDV